MVRKSRTRRFYTQENVLLFCFPSMRFDKSHFYITRSQSLTRFSFISCCVILFFLNLEEQALCTKIQFYILYSSLRRVTFLTLAHSPVIMIIYNGLPRSRVCMWRLHFTRGTHWKYETAFSPRLSQLSECSSMRSFYFFFFFVVKLRGTRIPF